MTDASCMMIKGVQRRGDPPANSFPDWLHEQIGLARGASGRSSGWLSRDRLIRKYADYLSQTGRPVTIEAIRAMLRFVDRGYSIKADQISRALSSRYAQGRAEKYSNGTAVIIDGKRFRSLREAAKAIRASPQTVSNRIRSSRPEWNGRRYDSSAE